MTPLMQTIFEHLRECGLDPYIDSLAQERISEELDQLYKALSAVLPDFCQELLKQYTLNMRARSLIETEAMFRAAYAAARELG